MERFTKFVIGSPAEREARATFRKYKEYPPRNYIEGRESAQASILARKLTRRQLGIGASLATLGAAVGARELYLRSQPDLYSGPIEDMEGLPLLSSTEIDKLANIMYETKNPLFRKVADGVYALATAQKNPAPDEFPEHIIRPDGFPAPVAENTSDETSYALTDGSIADTSKPPFLFINSARSRTSKFHYVEPYYMGIAIGTAGINTERQKAFDYAKAVLIAKEFMTLMLKTGNVRNAYPYFISNGYKFANEDGTEIQDPRDQNRAAFAVFAANVNEHLSPQWRTVDGIPTILLSAMIDDSKKLGGYHPAGNFSFTPFDDIAKKYLDRPGVREQTQVILDEWTQSPYRFLPHDNLIFEAFNKSGTFSNATQEMSLELFPS